MPVETIGVKEKVNVVVRVNLAEALETLNMVDQRKFLIQQMGKFITTEALNPEDLEFIKQAVTVINRCTGLSFADYNVGLPKDVAKKLGL